MKLEQARSSLKKLKQRYLLLRSIEICFFSASAVLVSYSVTNLFPVGLGLKVLMALSFGLAFAVTISVRYQLHRLRADFFTSHLNQQFPQLNESADLLLANDQDLSLLQQVQKEKTLRLLDQMLPKVKLPHRILQSCLVLVACVILHVVLSSLTPMAKTTGTPRQKEIRPDKNPSSIYIRSLKALISPPSYTGLSSFESSDFNLTLSEGSTVSWLAQFSSEPGNPKIIFSGKDSVNLIRKGSLDYWCTRSIQESGFYQLQWSANGKVYRSDFYKVDVIKDLPPKIAVKNLNQFTKFKYTDPLVVSVRSELSDDYGLTDAQIVATVSKGSGEGVKFREEKLKFTSPVSIVGKKLEATRIIDLKKLGLEPADELYFYIEAVDNKTPSPNRSRTETFFISIQDTSREISSVDAGFGVDLMPEYFRSQRQIIIDTEKLLRNKRSISVQQFKLTSNELGYDQKVLRLRYGQFLGEEDELGIGQPAEEPGEESDPLKKVTHQHDTNNEQNLVDQKGKQHEHAQESSTDEKKADPLKQFVHEHDNTEEATFFIQSLKTKLKAAITQMWDAELYLRLYQPEKSLPYQYRALNLLKEISSDSRIFVHRSGFDPPPLKEEKRLSGDLSDVKSRSELHKIEREENLSAIRDGIQAIEKMIAENTLAVSASNQKIFYRAGQELAALAREQPIVYLKGLTLIKTLSENQSSISSDDLVQLRAILWKALPSPAPSPIQGQSGGHSLNKLFLNNLDPRVHE